jgi:hypothetical protein
MMQSPDLGLADSTETASLHRPAVSFDLQIIHPSPQVKMPAPAAHFRISLGFKQLARRLHAVP